MGEATYYLKARFASAEDAERVFEDFKTALARLYDLNERWQAMRDKRELACAQRRVLLSREFRDLEGMVPWGAIDEHCRSFASGDAPMNCCAGEMPDIGGDPQVEVNGDEIWLSDMVWHSTSWDGVAHWLRQRGATGVGWISDEYTSPWDAVALE